MSLQESSPPAPAEAVDAQSFRAAVRHPANTVTVVTAGAPGARVGVTVTAVCSLSDEPPMVLACVNLRSSALATLRAAGAFCVNFLSEDQADIAGLFAGWGDLRGDLRFDDRLWTRLATGAPILRDSLASFDCLLAEEHASTTHSILMGRVLSVRASERRSPLIYSRGQFGAIKTI